MKILNLCLVLFLFVACGTIPVEQRACFNVAPDQSIFCKNVAGQWEEATALLRISNAVLLQEDVWEASEALKVVNELEALLVTPSTDPVNYSFFMKQVAKLAGPLVAVTINEAIKNYYHIELPITDFDKSLIRKELAEHRLIIEMALSYSK